jgi:oxygen-dependent protoporphyrinogen oxidase
VSARVPALVVGAGLSGLVCAYGLRKVGVDALVIEAADAPGGVIRTGKRDGYLLEYGPQSFNATAAVLQLCRELGIDDQLVAAPAKAPRFVLVDGELREVPLSPPAFLASPLFSAKTKFRVLRDVLGRSSPPTNDESVTAFVRRKFSAELLEKLVGPLVSGIYAGDPEKLSVRSAFPTLYEAEKSAGSVVRGLLRGGKKSDPPQERPTLQSFRDGNETLVNALAAKLGASLRCGVAARSVRQAAPAELGAAFEVTLTASGLAETVLTDRLFVATPTMQAAELLRDVNAGYAKALEAIDYAPVAVVSLGYAKTDVGHGLNGFGFLLPRSSGLRILGAVWNSSLFAGRAPEGHMLLTCFIGGATDRTVGSLPNTEIVATAHRELAPILGISRAPSFSHVQIWERAIPQYAIGHSVLMDQLETLGAKYLHLKLIGNYLRGPAIGACIEQSLEAALTARSEAGTR